MAGADLAAELRSALVGFAAGDALGAPWEGRVSKEIRGKLTPGAPGARSAQLWHSVDVLTRGGVVRGSDPLIDGLAIGLAVGEAPARTAAARPLGFPALMVAELTAWAVEGRSLRHAAYDTAEGWFLPVGGVRGPRALVAALLRLAHDYERPSDAIPAAVRLGGETGRLAALTGGVVGGRVAGAVERLVWIGDVALPAGLDELAARLAAARAP